VSGFRITCPVCCGGVLTPWGPTSEGNQRARCAHCYEAFTVTAHPDAIGQLYRVNKDAPFYPLVELVDGMTGISPQKPRSFTGPPHDHPDTIGDMEIAR
jgi:hypothetical protein